MRGFMSSQFYLRQILHSFDMFAFSEHLLFKEQLDLFTEFSETYQCHSISSNNNPNFLSGQGGVGLFWKNEYGDLITHLPIDSDRIVGVQFSFHLIDMPELIFLSFLCISIQQIIPLMNTRSVLLFFGRYLKLIVIAV